MTTTWLTPGMLEEITTRDDVLASVRRNLDLYVERGCNVLLLGKRRKGEKALEATIRCALAVSELRSRFLDSLQEAVEHSPALERDVSKTYSGHQDKVDDILGERVGQSAADCFSMGLRIATRTLQRFSKLDVSARLSMPRTAFRAWMQLRLLAECLDLAALSVLVFCEWRGKERAAASRPWIEELCFLVREVALEHAALLSVLLPGKKSLPRTRDVRLSDADRLFDRSWAKSVGSDLLSRIGA